MPAKKATKSANICVNIYEGAFMLNFDCVGVDKCRFALCPVMPPDGSEECTYHDYGSCSSLVAKYASLKTLRNMLTKEMKQYEGDKDA